MDRAEEAALRPGRAGPAARRRDRALETGLNHPIFEPYRIWLDRIGNRPDLEILNALSAERNLRTESGRPVRFVPPAPADPYYEVQVFETGRVQTRPDNLHDFFNALAWLAFPKTKARINALHAEDIPREQGRRGRRRDMLTIFDEGGAIVAGDEASERLVRQACWQRLFLEHHPRFRIVVLGHAVLEQALAPYPGITCKVVFAREGEPLDEVAASAVSRLISPRELPPVPVFGYPGWLAQSADPAFYADTRYFRPGKMEPGVGQAAAISQEIEESPGSRERDAG